MGRASLAKAVADAIRSDSRLPWHTTQQADLAAAVAISVVLAEVEHSIQALGTDWRIVRAGVTGYEPGRAADFKREALAVLAGLVPPPPV